MRWTDLGIVTSVTSFGEQGKIVTGLTKNHGLYKGFLRRASAATMVQPSTLAQMTWSGRLQEHLGSWTLEPFFQPLASLLYRSLPLAAVNAACSLIEVTIPERERVQGAYDLLESLVKTIAQSEEDQQWGKAYIHYEQTLLSLMGFKMDLTTCAATGSAENLIYISPKTGRAVSAQAGQPYHKKLLPLSPALIGKSHCLKDLHDGLKSLGYFLEKFILHPHGTTLTPARNRLMSSLAKRAL